MPGIILSLLVALAALCFAFYPDDSNRHVRKGWRDSAPQMSRRISETRTEVRGGTENPIEPDRSDSTGSAA